MQPLDIPRSEMFVTWGGRVSVQNSVEIWIDEALLHCPVMHRRSDKRRRNRELRPVRLHLHGELHGIEDRLERVAGQADDEEREGGDSVLTAEGYLFSKLVDEDRLAVDALLHL